MNKNPLPSERKALYKAHYKGQDVIEVLGFENVFGKSYAEIRFENGRTKSVPSEDIYIEEKK